MIQDLSPPIPLAMALAATRELTAIELELRPLVALMQSADGADAAPMTVLLARANSLADKVEELIGRLGQYLPPEVVDRVTRLRQELAEVEDNETRR